MWVKICANTNAADALAAIEAGADAVGFVFAPSKRQVTADQVAQIVGQLPSGIDLVGIFPNTSVDDIATAAAQARVTTIQLHGGIDTAFAQVLHERTGLPLIQTVTWPIGDPAAEDFVAAQLAEAVRSGVSDRILIDSKVGTASGGLGVRFDWSRAKQIFRSQPTLKLIVAGGLTPDNVAEAISELRPWGVDIASGVEQTPGCKDHAKMRAFVKNARSA